MAMLYSFKFDDNYFYYGKTAHKNIEDRYRTESDYTSKLLEKIKSGVLYKIKILYQTNKYENWRLIDQGEKYLITKWIDHPKCLNSHKTFTSLYDLVKYGTNDKLVLKIIDDYIHNNLTITDTAEKYNIDRTTLGKWTNGNHKRELLESNGYITFPIKKEGLTDNELTLKIIDDYIHNKLNQKETAKKWGIDPTTLGKWVAGSHRRKLLESNGYTFPIKKKELTNNEILTLKIINDYTQNNLNQTQTAKKWNISKGTLSMWLSGRIKRELLESKGYTFPVKKKKKG